MLKVVMNMLKVNNKVTILLTSETYLGDCQTSMMGLFAKICFCYPVDTGRELNVHKTFRRRPGRKLNVHKTFK